MSWKPSEIEIIDYLYGEMSPELDKKFAAYTKSNPGFAKEVEEFMQTQNIIKELPDEEVIPPIPLDIIADRQRNNRFERKWLYPASIAASLAALMLIGYITNFNISFNKDGFSMGFNNQSPLSETISKDEIMQLIDNKVSQAAEEWQSGITELQTSFTAQLKQNQSITEAEIKRVAAKKTPSTIDDEQILAFIAQLQVENKKAMQSFYQVSAEEQQKYMQNILLDFNEYLNEQREKDLLYIQANMLELKSTSALKQEETDKILASIITTVNNQYIIGE